MSKIEVTKADGTVETVDGTMNDKLFAHLGKSRGWVSYRNYDDGIAPKVFARTAADDVDDEYARHRAKMAKAMGY